MTTIKAKRAVVPIIECEILVDGFQLPNGEYRLSQTQVAEVVKMHRSTVLRYLKEKELDCPSNKTFTVLHIEAETGFHYNGKISAVTIDTALDFWYAQAFKGNKKAQALVYALGRETLQRRFDVAFEQQRTEEQYREQTKLTYQDGWSDVREYARFRHHCLTLACKANCFDGAKVHDLITLAVCGKTARELREDELIGNNPRIGLDHIQNSEVLKAIADVKYQFSALRTGSVQERVDKAVKLVLKGKKMS